MRPADWLTVFVNPNQPFDVTPGSLGSYSG